jgi:hypothetical protein
MFNFFLKFPYFRHEGPIPVPSVATREKTGPLHRMLGIERFCLPLPLDIADYVSKIDKAR